MGVRARLIAVLCFVSAAGCSLGALSGFSGGGSREGEGGPEGGSSTQVLVDGDASADDGGGPSEPPAGTDGGPDGGGDTCVNGPDRLCARFGGSLVSEGFSTHAGAGSFDATPEALSPPAAVVFLLPGPGGDIGPRFTATLAGAWTSFGCTVHIAIDLPPADSVVDIFGFETETGGVHEEAALRISSTGYRLISCRNSSDCRSEVAAGAFVGLGFLPYRFEWTREGEFKVAIDGVARGSTFTKTAIDGGTGVQVNMGLFFRPYGQDVARVRFDDLDCIRGGD